MDTHHKLTGAHIAFHVVAIVVGGFILFNLGFLLAAVVIRGTQILLGPTLGSPAIGRYVFLAVMGLISWFVFKSKLPTIAKATFMSLPLITLLLMIGISFFGTPLWLTIALDATVIGVVLFNLKQNHYPWQYYFSTGYVAILMVIIGITGMDI